METVPSFDAWCCLLEACSVHFDIVRARGMTSFLFLGVLEEGGASMSGVDLLSLVILRLV